MKKKTLNCPTCGGIKSIEMHIGEIEDDGFTVKIFNCKNCNAQHILNKDARLEVVTPST